MRSLLVPLFVAAIVVSPAVAAPRRRAAPRMPTFCSAGSDIAGVTVPEGFCVRKFVDVPTPRVLAFAPNGDLFVSSPAEATPGGAPAGDAAIYVFRQTDPTLPPVRTTFAAGPQFDTVHGLAFTSGSLLYSVRDGVFAAPYATGDLTMRSGSQEIIDMSDTNAASRWTHTIAVSTSGSIYASRGQFDNTSSCGGSNRRNGSILQAGSDPSGDLVSSGFRDPLYMRCMPWGSCYAIELSGDTWEDFGGSEKLIEIHKGDDFGYPCCIGPNHPNPELLNQLPPVVPDCSRVAVTLQPFPLHDTPFGFDWERRLGLWPPPYEGAFFVGLHGEFSSWKNAGLQWAAVDSNTHLPVGQTTPFLQGVGHFKSIKRVADVVFAPDGRLFFTDDQGSEKSDTPGGAIYWIAPKTLVRR
jgi:glucose/arabinose dehydrogenase